MLNYWLIGAVAVVIIVRRFSRIAAGIGGMLVAAGLGIWGATHYSDGQTVAFAGKPVPQPMFFLIAGIWFAIEAFGLWSALQTRKRDDGKQNDTPPPT